MREPVSPAVQRRSRRLLLLLGLAGLLASTPPSVRAQTAFRDALVQPPGLTPPSRGSVAGAFSGLEWSAGQVSRGAFLLGPHITVPEDRGPLLARVFPQYSIEGGISEWGMGWASALAIERVRISGEIDYATDDFSSPWGRVVQGDDGAWYPHGLRTLVRLVLTDGNWIATTAEGTRFVFEAEDSVTTERGTYRWMLSAVSTIQGDRTRLTYRRNASGWKALERVEYGGRGEHAQYRLELDYEPLRMPFVDRRSGTPLVLDVRVREIRVEARREGSGDFEPRWTYALGYQEGEASPAFYLARVQRTYSRGGAEAPMTYAYASARAHLASAALTSSDALDDFLVRAGAGALDPDRAAPVDVEADGMLEFEHSAAYTLLRQSEGRWRYEALPSAGGVHPWCRGAPNAPNTPRLLAHLTGDALEPSVVAAQRVPGRNETRVVVCDRLGRPRLERSWAGDWRLDAVGRLVDLNRDRRPDLVRVSLGGYQVLENRSRGAAVDFEPHRRRALALPFEPSASWFHDVNGDGNVDLIVRSSQALHVFHGLGHLEFEETGRIAELRVAGAALGELQNRQITFLDANRDGLADLLVSRGTAFLLFLNRGDAWQQEPVPAFTGIGGHVGHPLALDLSGSGEAEVAFVRDGHLATLTLTRPDVGLMTEMADGKGNRLAFQYGRASPVPGLGLRPVVLSRVDVHSAGAASFAYAFRHEAPVVDMTSGAFIGFERVVRDAPNGREEVEFVQDDVASGLLRRREVFEAGAPALAHFERTTYAPANFRGVSWHRGRAVERGARALPTGREAVARTEYLQFFGEVCPAVIEEASGSGTLTRTLEYPPLSGFVELPHCLPGRETLRGVHADGALDFEHHARMQRDAAGRVERVVAEGTFGEQVLQLIDYDAQGRIAGIEVPGRGRTTHAYHPETGLLSRVVAPDGTTTQVTAQDPVSDAVLELFTARGPGAGLRAGFRYDGWERLALRFDDLDASSPDDPLERLEYQEATEGRPAATIVRTRVDAASTRTVATLVTAAGTAIGAAMRGPDGWLFGGLTRFDTSRGERSTGRRGPFASPGPLPATYAELFRELVELSLERQGMNGTPLGESTWLGEGQRVETTSTYEVTSEGRVRVTAREAGEVAEVSTLDATGLVEVREDATGARTSFHRDALGRIRKVDLPDGKQHRLDYDDLGRVARIERDDVASIDFVHDPRTGLLTDAIVSAPSGALGRSTSYAYDAIGRPTTKTFVDLTRTASAAYEYFYDGRTAGGGALLPGQLGFSTQVSGPGYARTTTYDAGGRLSTERLEWKGWRTLRRQYHYHADGSLKVMEEAVIDTRGEVLFRQAVQHRQDAWGRLEGIEVGGERLLTARYDADGELTAVDFAGGERIELGHDPRTHALNLQQQRTTRFTSSVGWSWNARGAIAREDLRVGDSALVRSYTYDSRGFLARAEDSEQTSSYEYDPSGLPARISDPLGERTLVPVEGGLEVDGHVEAMDAFGRTLSREGVAVEYGPTGDVARAWRGSDGWSYLYDEAGQRVAKLRDGSPVWGRAGDTVLTDAELVEPIRVAGRVVGLLSNGRFEMVGVDGRGSVIASADGRLLAATPFGARLEHPERAEILDFVEHGYDADLGTIRLGVRDYDPRLGRFTTPDPTFLEDPDLCVARPTECNLYGYARNSPLTFVDPEGRAFNLGTALLGAGIELARQVWNREEVNGARIAASAAGGLAAGFTFGASLLAQAASAGAMSSAGGTVTRALLGEQTQLADAAKDFALGTVTFGLSRAVGSGLRAVRSSIRGTAGLADDVGELATRLCFPAGTPVLTPEGPVPIEVLSVGDDVLAYDEAVGEVVVREIEATHPNLANRLVAVVYEGGQVEATRSHPFWVEGLGWTAASALVPGMRLRTPEGTAQILETRPLEGARPVFNLSVALAHDYFVGGVPVLVHNQDESFSNYGKAMGRAFDWLRGKGVDLSQLTEVRDARIGSGRGLTTPKGTSGFRIEWDPRSGAHINAWTHRGKSPHFKFPGNEQSVKRLLRNLYCR